MADLDVRLVRGAALAADLWFLTNADRAMTEAERTRGLVRAAIDHLVDNGLLLVPEDLPERLDRHQRYRSAREIEPDDGPGPV